MATKFMRRALCPLPIAIAAGAISLAGAGCSTEEQAAIGTIEMGKADKNNLMSFGEGGDAAAPTQTSTGGGRRGGRGRGDSGGLVKSIKGGGGGAGATP